MRIKQFLIAVCIGTMFAACSSKDDYGMTNDDTIKLRATVAAPTIGTRVGANDPGIITTGLPVGEKINVHFYKTTENVDLFTGTTEYTNRFYTIGSNNSLTADDITEPSWGNNTLDILATYPSKYLDLGPGQESTEWLVLDDQKTIEKHKESDLMIAQLHGKTKSYGPITLPFKHVLTKIIVKLESGESGLDVTTAKNIRLYCDDNYEIVSDAHNNLSINTYLNDPTTIDLGDYNSNGVTGIIPPQTLPFEAQYHDDYFITFEIGGVKYNFDPAAITLKGGYQYTFTLTIDNNTVKAKNFTVEPWTTTEPECTQNGSATY